MLRRCTTSARAALAVAVLAAACLVGPLATPAAASRDGGASSRVVGRGDIVTTIVGWQLGSASPSRRGARARCRWVTLQDAQIEWLVAASSRRVLADGVHPVLDSVRSLLGAGELPDGDLRARVCRGIAVDLRFDPADASDGVAATVRRLHRRMITRLPVPEPEWSPPAEAAVPVRQPVFASIPESRWRPIEAALTVDGTTATVRARPTGLRVMTGDPTGLPVECEGRGRPFDPSSRVGVSAQATAPDACVVRYRTATATGAADDRPETWIGTVTVLWEAEWRTDGPWISLGTIPRTRLFDRRVTEVRSSIESRR